MIRIAKELKMVVAMIKIANELKMVVEVSLDMVQQFKDFWQHFSDFCAFAILDLGIALTKVIECLQQSND